MEEKLREHPSIRPLMAFPIQTEQGESICLRDPEGISEAILVINRATYLLVTLMDGVRSVREIQAEFLRETGTLVPDEQILEVVDKLGQALFLDDELFRRRRSGLEEDFLNSGSRLPAHQGAAYPEDPRELTLFLDRFFAPLAESADGGPRPSGIIAPHIDIREAGACYASAYQHLRRSTPSTVIILGTAHSDIGPARYSICPKDFETPLGVLRCDQEGIGILQEMTGTDWTRGQVGHRTEHSIEFQAVFLRYLFREREVRIIPVLCNSLADLLEGADGPMENSEIRAFIEALQHLVRRRPGEIALIAGADLSHVGPKFGHPSPVTETDLAGLKSHDLSLLKHAEEGDGEEFFRAIQGEGDSNNVCGVPNIYTLLKVLDGQKGRLLNYGQFFEESTASAVSYASLVFP